jgi:hypothetical protein
MSSMQFITFDEDGNCIGSNFMDYLIPTAWETPRFELGATVTPSPHHPIGAKGVGESATVGSPAAFVRGDRPLAHLGVRNIDMPVLLAAWSATRDAEAAQGERPTTRRAAALERRGEPFVLAWSQAASAVVGARRVKALVMPDGSMRGWPGARAPSRPCAAGVVTLADGRSRLPLLGIPGAAAALGEGASSPMVCGSEGRSPCI